MTNEQWDALVRRLESQARENPRGYGRKVVLLGALGYVFLAASLLALAALGALVVVLAIKGPGILLKLLLPIGALAWVIVRSIPVHFESPRGVRIRRQDAPELFGMLDDVKKRVRGPKLHAVLVDDELNASVVQIPRLAGLLGQRNILVLGLPYMQALSADELRAVVGHELGHLSKNHGRLAAWVYRVRVTWMQLLARLEAERRAASFVFRRFFEWYAPYFGAYSFPLMRAHEFEADEAAAEAAGARPAATALATAAVAARYLDFEYWPRVFERARDEQSPPAALAALATEVAGARRHRAARAWFEDELAREADTADTHPPLAERVRRLGFEPEEVFAAATGSGAATADGAPTRESAAAVYLGPAEDEVTRRVDELWREAIGPGWAERHAELRRARARLAELEERAGREELPLDEARERAALTSELRTPDDALPLYAKLVERAPDDAPAHYALGQLLLARDDDAGLRHLERAMDLDPEAVVPACRNAFAYLEERGRDEEAERYRRRAQEQAETFRRAAAERETVGEDDTFLPHGLRDDVVGAVRRRLEVDDGVARGYLVRKDLAHLAEDYPLFVVGIVPKSRLRLRWRNADADKPTLAQQIASDLELPGEWHVVVPARGSALLSRIQAVPGAEIYRA